MSSVTGGRAEERFGGVRRSAGLVLGPIAFVTILAAPLDLAAPAHRLAAVAALMVILWVTEGVPLAVTAVVGPALAVTLGVARPREVFSPFGDPVIFLFLGSFLLAEALRVHGIDRRIALWVLTRPGAAASPMRARIMVGLVTAAISMWINNTATVAVMLPIALGLVRALAAADTGESPRGTLLVVGIAASLGGIATPVGSTPNLVALGFYQQIAGQSLSFPVFMAIGLPLSLALIGIALLVARVLLPGGASSRDPAVYVAVARERAALPEWGHAQTACAVAFGLAVLGWLVPGLVALVHRGETPLDRLSEAVVALLAAGLLFAWPVGGRRALTWEEASRIDWGTLLLFGGGLSMGKLMFDTGLAARLGQSAVTATGVTSVWGLTALALAATIVLTEIASNTATVSVMAPLALALSKEMGLPPAPPLLAVCFGASMGFMLPMGTPPNAMVYGTGLVPLTSMMGVGLVVDLLSFGVILAALRALCPLLGLV
jgi:sodium-dependent dicarboxylate transporter 2/3/5